MIEQGMIEQGVIELSAAQARRIAVAAALLGTPRPADLLEVARGVAAVQVDATSYVAPSAEIVFWSRLGRRFAAHGRSVQADGLAWMPVPSEWATAGQSCAVRSAPSATTRQPKPCAMPRIARNI